jgi:hypothetical protein
VSGPARPAVATQPARARSTGGEAGLVLGLISALEGLAQHRLLDRLIRGRTWIGLMAFALIGIVTLQLGLLKLNGGIGRALEHEALLQRENAALSIENSEMAAGNRIEARASQQGMAFVTAGALRFLATRPHGDAATAAAALSSAAHTAAAAAQEASAVGSSEAQASTESGAESSGGESSESSASEASGESESSTSGAEGSTTSSAESSAAATGAPASAESSESAASTSAEGGPVGGIQASSAGE